MSNLSLKFTKKQGKFCFCALVKGTQVCHYKVVKVLKIQFFQAESSNSTSLFKIAYRE